MDHGDAAGGVVAVCSTGAAGSRQGDGAEAATAAEETQCRACAYERIGPKVDIGLVALVSLLVVGLLVAVSREWGTTSQRWTCRTLALLLVGIGLALLWWAGSVVTWATTRGGAARTRRRLARFDAAEYVAEVAGGTGAGRLRAFHLETQ